MNPYLKEMLTKYKDRPDVSSFLDFGVIPSSDYIDVLQKTAKLITEEILIDSNDSFLIVKVANFSNIINVSLVKDTNDIASPYQATIVSNDGGELKCVVESSIVAGFYTINITDSENTTIMNERVKIYTKRVLTSGYNYESNKNSQLIFSSNPTNSGSIKVCNSSGDVVLSSQMNNNNSYTMNLDAGLYMIDVIETDSIRYQIPTAVSFKMQIIKTEEQLSMLDFYNYEIRVAFDKSIENQNINAEISDADGLIAIANQVVTANEIRMQFTKNSLSLNVTYRLIFTTNINEEFTNALSSTFANTYEAEYKIKNIIQVAPVENKMKFKVSPTGDGGDFGFVLIEIPNGGDVQNLKNITLTATKHLDPAEFDVNKDIHAQLYSIYNSAIICVGLGPDDATGGSTYKRTSQTFKFKDLLGNGMYGWFHYDKDNWYEFYSVENQSKHGISVSSVNFTSPGNVYICTYSLASKSGSPVVLEESVSFDNLDFSSYTLYSW